jgi:hypothetical protein
VTSGIDSPKTTGAVSIGNSMERRNRGSRSSTRPPLPVAYHHSSVEASPVTVTLAATSGCLREVEVVAEHGGGKRQERDAGQQQVDPEQG